MKHMSVITSNPDFRFTSYTAWMKMIRNRNNQTEAEKFYINKIDNELWDINNAKFKLNKNK